MQALADIPRASHLIGGGVRYRTAADKLYEKENGKHGFHVIDSLL